MKKRRILKMTSVILALFLLASCAARGSGSVSSVIANSEGHKTESNVLTESATNGNNTSEISSAPSANASQTNQQTPLTSAQQPEDISLEGKQRADNLMKELKNTDTDIIRFYNAEGTGLRRVGFQRFIECAEKKQPNHTISDLIEIKEFITELKLEKWTPKRFSLKSLPKAVIYISKDLHINLEAQSQGISWMSINSAENKNVYFVVPNDVYKNMLAYFKEEKYICKATLDDNFSDDKVLFVINKELSKSDPEFTPDDFKNIEIAEIRRITSAIGDLTSPSATPEEAERKKKTLALTNLEEFHHIYEIKLKNPSKENVLKAIKELEKIDYIVSAEPNYYFSLE